MGGHGPQTRINKLLDQHYSLHDRLKLFEAGVSPAILYAAGTWTFIKQHEHELQRTQRRMLRMVLAARRRRYQANPTDTRNEQSDDDGHDVNSDAENASEAQVGPMEDEVVLEP